MATLVRMTEPDRKSILGCPLNPLTIHCRLTLQVVLSSLEQEDWKPQSCNDLRLCSCRLTLQSLRAASATFLPRFAELGNCVFHHGGHPGTMPRVWACDCRTSAVPRDWQSGCFHRWPGQAGNNISMARTQQSQHRAPAPIPYRLMH